MKMKLKAFISLIAVLALFASLDMTLDNEGRHALCLASMEENAMAERQELQSIAAGTNHTVGLKKDGTVVAVGANDRDQCDVENWTEIVAIVAGRYHTIGLKQDGTAVSVGNNARVHNVKDWTDIVAIAAGDCHTVGLKQDGTVVAMGLNGFGQCDVENWTDIAAIAAGDCYTVGLKQDGTVVAVGYFIDELCAAQS